MMTKNISNNEEEDPMARRRMIELSNFGDDSGYDS